MTDYAATTVSGNTGAAVTERTGATSGDTVPAGTLIAWRNTGAGSHTVTITTNNQVRGLDVADRTITVAAGATWVERVPSDWGDANGKCAVAISGTATEVKYLIMGGV